jgi:2',3'-cyclic-nucleotide 2'-phosphodiesterase (5'-nucleotidase family)
VERAAEIVRSLKRENDIVIVSFHGGAEGARALHVADAAETYANEMRGNVLRFARTAVDAGADMVLGHGPHVVRAMEVYKKKLIVYSLGSFLAFGRFNISGREGLSMVMKAVIDAGTGNFVSGRIIPLKLREGGIPFPDEEGESVRLIKRLTQEDLGSSAMLITDSGDFYPTRPPAKKSWFRSLYDRLKRLF